MSKYTGTCTPSQKCMVGDRKNNIFNPKKYSYNVMDPFDYTKTISYDAPSTFDELYRQDGGRAMIDG